jgi:hypothetical protein
LLAAHWLRARERRGTLLHHVLQLRLHTPNHVQYKDLSGIFGIGFVTPR